MSAASWPGRPDSGIGIAPVRRGLLNDQAIALYRYRNLPSILERKR